MHCTTPEDVVRPASVDDAALVHRIYMATPDYFKIISIPVPTLAEVETELRTASSDNRRYTELILAPADFQHEAAEYDEQTGRPVVGYLDYKLHYPDQNDAMVNLLLIMAPLQSHGFGRHCAMDLEARLQGKTKRILASIYGQNPRAERFWRSLGYSFAIDAKPVLDWYAKELC